MLKSAVRSASVCTLRSSAASHSDAQAGLPDLGYVTIQMSLLRKEKPAISSILPLQNGGSRTPSNSKYLLSNSIGVLGVSASLSAIVDTSRQGQNSNCARWRELLLSFCQVKLLIKSARRIIVSFFFFFSCVAPWYWSSLQKRVTANQPGEKWRNARGPPHQDQSVRAPVKEGRYNTANMQREKERDPHKGVWPLQDVNF